MNRSLVTTAGAVLLLTVVGHSQNAGTGRLRAGAHKVDCTPKVSELQPATDSIRDHLFARAIVEFPGSDGVPVGVYIYSDRAYSHLTFQDRIQAEAWLR